MKMLSLILLMVIHHSFAQYPRKANVAIIETDSLKASRLFSECVDILMEEGYHLNQLNVSSLTLKTDPIQIHDLPLLFKLHVEVKGTMAFVRGYILDDRDFVNLGLYEIPKKWEDAAYRSFGGSIWRTGFDVVIEIVEKIRSHTYGKVRWNREEL